MTNNSPDFPTLSPSAASMIVLAACGFVLAKVLILIDLLLNGSDGLSPTLLLALGTDGAVLVWFILGGLLVPRPWATRRLVRWGLPLAGFVVGAYALLNVFFVLEIGTPLTRDLFQVDAGVGEASAMLKSSAARITLGGLVAYLLLVYPLLRFVAAPVSRSWRGLASALTLYSASALLVTVASPNTTAVHGLHRNAVTVLLLSLRDDASGLAMAHESSASIRPTVYATPEGDHWTKPIPVSEATPPRHVVLWIAESTGFRHTTLHDQTLDTTPNLTRLRTNSLWFTNYYANAPLSAQAMFGILCSMYPHPTGVPIAQANPRIACPSLMETLVDRGYRAGLFTGALFGFGDKQKFFVERGFDILVDGETVSDRSRYWSDGWGVDDAAIVADALRWLDERPDPDQPTLTVMIPIIPHAPYGLPPGTETPFGTDTRVGHYRNGLRYADSLFGQFYDSYVERGLADDTLFIYVGDHGEAFEEHPGNRYHVSYMYDENMHVPLMFINPRLFPSETVTHRLGSHVDLMPTILELLGEDEPTGIQGQSLISDDYQYRPVYMGSYVNGHRGGLRDGRYKFIHHYNTGLDEVYDLSRDRLEQHNLASQIDSDQVDTWRRWVFEYHASQRQFLSQYDTLGETYLQRIHPALTVALENDGERLECGPKDPRGRTLACDGQPEVLEVSRGKEFLKGVRRECLRVHPPAEGAMVIEFSDIQPPSFVGAGVLDPERKKGGAPVEVTWHLGALDTISMTLTDTEDSAYNLQRLAIPENVLSTDVRIEIRSTDWTNRATCLVLAP